MLPGQTQTDDVSFAWVLMRYGGDSAVYVAATAKAILSAVELLVLAQVTEQGRLGDGVRHLRAIGWSPACAY